MRKPLTVQHRRAPAGSCPRLWAGRPLRFAGGRNLVARQELRPYSFVGTIVKVAPAGFASARMRSARPAAFRSASASGKPFGVSGRLWPTSVSHAKPRTFVRSSISGHAAADRSAAENAASAPVSRPSVSCFRVNVPTFASPSNRSNWSPAGGAT